MTPLEVQTRQITDQLEALRATDNVPSKAKASCARLAEQLQAPARIGMLGVPGSGKRLILNALCGEEIADESLPLPTSEISYGADVETEAMLADGTLVQVEGLPTEDILARSPVFLKVRAPWHALAGRSLLMVVSEANSADAVAALNWAADKVDICLWCTKANSAAEHALWSFAPERLLNHAILIRPIGEMPAGFHASDEGFEAAFALRQDQPDAGDAMVALSDYLANAVTEAKTQEIHAAQMVLRRYGDEILDETLRQEAPVPATPAPAPSPVAVTELSRMFQTLRGTADGLRRALGQGEADVEIDTVLETTEKLFGGLSDRAADLDCLEDSHPALSTLLQDAHDLALLLRMEGGPEQAMDAARLIRQVRGEMEVMLAA